MIIYDPNLQAEDVDLIIPDDEIIVDAELQNKLLSLWCSDSRDIEKIKRIINSGGTPTCIPPADLLISNTIPLPAFWVMWKGVRILFNTNENDVLFATKAAVFRAFIREDEQWEIRIRSTHPLDGPKDKRYMETIAWLLLDTWYGLQILLLNPLTATLFKNPKTEKEYTREGRGKDRKRVVKYIRKHYITPEGIDEALYGHGHRDFKRKTMAWYVIGHWRQYKNGTRKFIKGYWKGPLREMKRNLDGGRIRQLAVQEV